MLVLVQLFDPYVAVDYFGSRYVKNMRKHWKNDFVFSRLYVIILPLMGVTMGRI